MFFSFFMFFSIYFTINMQRVAVHHFINCRLPLYYAVVCNINNIYAFNDIVFEFYMNITLIETEFTFTCEQWIIISVDHHTAIITYALVIWKTCVCVCIIIYINYIYIYIYIIYIYNHFGYCLFSFYVWQLFFKRAPKGPEKVSRY